MSRKYNLKYIAKNIQKIRSNSSKEKASLLYGWFVSKGHVLVLPQSSAAEQNLRAPPSLKILVFTAQINSVEM